MALLAGVVRPWQTRWVQRIDRLDGLRGLAALAVVVYHYFDRASEIYPELHPGSSWLEFGAGGVQVFFVISGFVIFGTLSRGNPRRFVLHRFIRLYPTYWICLTITVAVIAVFGLPGREVTPAATVINYTMLQGFVGVPSVDGAYWTLAPELSFYVQILLIWLLGALRGARSLLWVIPLWCLAAVVINLWSVIPGAEVVTATEIYKFTHVSIMWIPCFAAGVALTQWRVNNSLTYLPVLVAIGAAFTIEGAGPGVATAIASLLVVLLVTSKWRVLDIFRWRPLVVLGAISYVLYLLHQNIGYIAIRGMAAAGLPYIVAAAIALIGILVLAYLITRILDEPIRRWLRQRLSSTPKTIRVNIHDVP